MGVREDFDADYDGVIGKFCRPYGKFFEIGAAAIPRDVVSVCDLGIGSGNFSVEVVKRISCVDIYGIDISKSMQSKKR